MAQTKKTSPKFLLNSLESSVRDNLIGIALTNNNVQITEHIDAIVRKDFNILRERGSVMLISGGGAGHEPMFAGFVGPNMLTAAVSGSYFASPSAGQIIKLVEQIANVNTPVLLIVANYTGDRLNFGLAKEYLILKGFKDVRLFVFGDDLAPYLTETKSEDVQPKRRGLAGIAFIHRIAGVLSEQGKTLDEIECRLNQLPKLIYTISISLSACDIPGHGASFYLDSDQMELGLGVHGESGIKRVPLSSAREAIDLMSTELVNYLSKDALLRQCNDRVALIINNLGGLTQMELNVVIKEVIEQMTAKKVIVHRVYFGCVMTSFNMKGVSLTAMLLNDQLVHILDQTQLLASSGATINSDFIYRFEQSNSIGLDLNDSIQMGDYCEPGLYRDILTNACRQMIKHEHELNELDETVGDSDCGSTLSAIARLFLDQIQLNRDQPPSFTTLARLVSERIGGSSGALYSLLFTSAANYIKIHKDTFARSDLTNSKRALSWLQLVQYCIERICTYSGARVNDRSMIDALHGIVIGLQKCATFNCSISEMARLVTECTWTQARKTASMKARVGRAAYVNESYITKPDAGAVGVAIWTEALAHTLTQTFGSD